MLGFGEGPDFWWFFACAMIGAAMGFGLGRASK